MKNLRLLDNIIKFSPKTNYFLVLFCVLLFASCTTIVKTLYGIRKPKIETQQSIIKYAHKNDLDVDRIVCFSREDWAWIIQEKKINNVPDIFIFNKEGRLLIIREKEQCNAINESVISSLAPDKRFEIDEYLLLDEAHSKLRNLDGKPIKTEKKINADFTIYVFWTKYTGRLNKTKALVWQKEAKNNRNCTIDFYLVNMDMQQWWDE
jgi:hypothetical protein